MNSTDCERANMKLWRNYYADGQFRAATGDRRTAVTAPATAEEIAELNLCSGDDLDVALKAASRASRLWAGSTLDERKAALRRLKASLEERRAQAVEALAQEIGCPVWLGNLMQIPMALRDLDLAIEGIDEVIWSEKIGNGVVERVPVGVVGAMTPWNFPVHQIAAKVAGAIAAGCAVVLKPSEIAPGVAHCFMEALHAADLPPGLVNVLLGDAELGARIVDDPRIDQISFTGSTATGRRIMASVSESLKRTTLELGGKSACILLDDADLDAALPVAMRMAMVNTGQTCVAQSRLIVPKHRMGEVSDRLAALAGQWPLGSPLDPGTRMGPVASRRQFELVSAAIHRGREQGARLLCGGSGDGAGGAPGRGWFIAPTVFLDVTPSMAVAQQEVFGPVLAVMASKDDDDAVQIANGTPYGLSGAVWSKDTERAQRIARQLRTGQVIINGAAQNLATPFGGWGQSGFGRENGRFGIEEFLQYRALHIDAPSEGPAAGPHR